MLLRCIDSTDAKRILEKIHKGVRGTSYASVTRSILCKFIKKEVICRYGLPEKIISNNAHNLNNTVIKEVCDQFKINH